MKLAVKGKISIAIPPDVLALATQEAEKREVSVSALLTAALEQERRRPAMGELLEMLGGTDDITGTDIKKIEDEWREVGLTR